MSRATDLARAEAEATEAEEAAEDEATDEPTDEPEAPTEPAEDDGASLEATFKKIDGEQARHEAELRSIFGADFDAMAGCPVCDTLGYRSLDAPVVDPTLDVCPNCRGWGFTITPSLQPGKDAQPCIICQEKGFVTKPVGVPAPATATPVQMFDPYTGLPVAPAYTPPGQPVSPNGEWAPGFVPPPQPIPGR